MGLAPSELMQCLIPPSDMVQVGVQQLLIVELILMEMHAEGKVELVVSQFLVVQE